MIWLFLILLQGITGSGKNGPITTAKAIMPGTIQGCLKATGTI
jgi:hypothetical protein